MNLMKIESYTITPQGLHVVGWLISSSAKHHGVKVYDKDHKELNTEIRFYHREDINKKFCLADQTEAGFRLLVLEEDIKKRCPFTFQQEGVEETIVFDSDAYVKLMFEEKRNFAALFYRGMRFLKRYGIKKTIEKTYRKIFPKKDVSYEKWREAHALTEEKLKKQRKHHFAYEPLISIVVPLYRTDESFLDLMIQSVLNQSYKKLELCLADGSVENEGEPSLLEAHIREWMKKDERIRYRVLPHNLGIAQNTNAAIEMAEGDYIAFLDHDDELTLDALYWCVNAINQHIHADVIYSDQDKVDFEEKEFFEPFFKPNFNFELLRSMNYICHFFLVSKRLIHSVDWLKEEFDGAQDYDFTLRCCEQAKEIVHIPRILYHWRCHPASTAENPVSKLYAFEAGKRAVTEHYRRMGIPAKAKSTNILGTYRAKYSWDKTPLVSVIIPNKDHIDDLKKCISSLEEASEYRNFEIIVVENNSTQTETFEYYKELEEQTHTKVLYYEGEFNYSKINNFGAREAKGDYLLLLNNDTCAMDGSLMEELLGYAMRDDVGAVGARLCYGDDTIQHVGVLIGAGGVAGHVLVGAPKDGPGYFNRIVATQEVSAVTAACLMVSKEKYFEVGGMTEELSVAFNDVDFCLKLRNRKYKNIYAANALMYHYESKSRGYENDENRKKRFASELEYMKEIWGETLDEDPYYNKNLNLDKADYSLWI